MGALWPLGCLGLGSLGRPEGLLDPAVGAPRPSWCQQMSAVLWGWRAGNTRLVVRKPLAQSQRRMEGIPCSRTHGPSGAGLPCGRLLWPTCFWQDPAPLSHGIELWMGPRSHEIPGPGPYHSSEPLFRARQVSDHRSQPPRGPPPAFLSSLTPRRTKRTE